MARKADAATPARYGTAAQSRRFEGGPEADQPNDSPTPAFPAPIEDAADLRLVRSYLSATLFAPYDRDLAETWHGS